MAISSIDLQPIDFPPPTLLEEIRTSKLRPFGPVLSGIDKQVRSGRLYVSSLGLSEDEHDLTFHGGIDKAIHQYCTSHYSFWRDAFPTADIGAKFVAGGFGENFVADGLCETNMCIGDLVRVGHPDSVLTGGPNGCLLQVSLPRQPCFKLNQRFGIKNFAPRTHQEAKTGWYYRVIEEGWIEQGMQIQVIERRSPKWSIARLHHYVHRDKSDVAVAEELASMDVIGDECRNVFVSRLRKMRADAAKSKEKWTELRVKSKTLETPRIARLELEKAQKDDSPDAITPGSHAYIKLPNGLKRAYSIVSGDANSFVLGVARDDKSRGGSSYIHKTIMAGDTISLGSIGEGMCRDQMASNHIFVAGGIGITAFLAMMACLRNINQTFQLHYAVRETSEVAFTSLLSQFPDSVTIYDKSKRQRMDITKILEHRIWNSHVYICGPQRMIDSTIEAATVVGMASDEVHYEVFQADTSGDPFSVDVLSGPKEKTKKTLQVGTEQSLLDVMRDAGFDIGSSCEVGTCGTCRIAVKCGRVQHRGTALTKAEQKDEMLACVSRGIGHIFVELPED